MNPRQMILFGIEFMQMMEDFATPKHCPSCRKETREALICLDDNCDFVLFINYGENIHPAFFTFVAEKTKEASK
jgi:hypothetical protein